MFELAPALGARVVFLEHRYYGKSLPFGNASYDSYNLRFLTIEQALADMSEFIAAKARVAYAAGPSTDASECAGFQVC